MGQKIQGDFYNLAICMCFFPPLRGSCSVFIIVLIKYRHDVALKIECLP